ncbi:MAG: carbohydrate ABC transporter permease [Ruminiclostridium sp.]|nr:carbohydrate ABC transporter permease [Ruminiclostridium sp.]
MNKKRNIALLIGFLKYLSLAAGVLAVFLPILMVFFAAFKTEKEYNSTSPLQLPENFFNFENFKRAIVEGDMLKGLTNTAIILVFSVCGAILLGSMVAYVLDRFRFPGRKAILTAFLFATLIPSVTTQVATFKIVNSLGLFNTRMAAIILYLGTDIMAIYIFMQFISSISVSLDESAKLDGASYLTIFIRIIFPLMKPAIVTVLIVRGISVYNDFYTPFLYMPKKELKVISTGLFNFIGPYGAHWEIICAMIVLAIIPTLIVFLSLQKYLYNGFTQGSVKG